ncbi:MAG: hypothetical protein NTW87_19720 [Planctomycetota bacterium]|nr:hypothetical protein [Planctomycetota bacterium]
MKALDRPLAVFGLLALATAIVLHGNLTAPFYHLDDRYCVQHAVAGPWTTALAPREGNMYFPVVSLSWRLDRALFGPPREDVNDLLQPPPPKAARGR